MGQRIKDFDVGRSIAFMAGVEQSDENLELSSVVHPVLQLPFVPPPFSAGHVPFLGGGALPGVAAEFAHVGIFNASGTVIMQVKQIHITNQTGGPISVDVSSEPGPVSGIDSTKVLRSGYLVNNQPTARSAQQAIAFDSEAAIRGNTLIGGIPVPDDDIVDLEVDFYIANGAVWVVSTVLDVDVHAWFSGFLIPVIAGQANL